MPDKGTINLNNFQLMIAYGISSIGLSLLPLSLFWGESTLPLFWITIALPLALVFLRKDTLTLLPYVRSILPFLLWSLASCYSASTYYSLFSWFIALVTVICGISFYIYLTNDLQNRFFRWYKLGYFICVGLLILDEILNTAILRTLIGQTTDTPAYYPGITLLVMSSWIIFSDMKDSHLSRKIIALLALCIAVFYSTDLLSKVALLFGFVTFSITYLCPKWSTRILTLMSISILLTTPLIIEHTNTQTVIEKLKNVKESYPFLHRIPVLKHTSQLINNAPIVGHGFNSFSSTSNPSDSWIQPDNILQVENMIELAEKGLSPISYSLNMQIWHDLGLLGAILFSFILIQVLWPLSYTENKRIQLSSFMSFYVVSTFYANTAFNAHSTWWLVSNAILAVLALRKVNT